ncbi:hypothetical protein Bca4012_041960 [Brassica carinata]
MYAFVMIAYESWLEFILSWNREYGSRNVLKPMDSEQMREYGHRMVDFIADYYKTIETFPVRSQVQPGYLHNLLPDSAPDHPETLEQVLDDVKAKILPGVTHWQSPSFFAYYPSNSSVAGFLGEMLSTGLNVIGFSWVASPAATELEIIVLDWLAKLLNLPEQFLSKALKRKLEEMMVAGNAEETEDVEAEASEANLVVDYKDWQIALSRRFRSLKLWMVLRLYGAETLKSCIRNHIKLAKVFEQLVSQDPNFEVITPRTFSLVCFRMVPIDDDEKKCNSRNLELLEAVNSSGKLFISHCKY